MSNRTGANFRARPADSAWAANDRWALNGNLRRRQPAYTAESHEVDVSAGIVEAPVIVRVDRRCPADRPERRCVIVDRDQRHGAERGEFSVHYSTGWRQVHVFEPLEPTKADPHPRPRRRRTTSLRICYDCKAWLWWKDRRNFERDYGVYSLEEAELAFRVTKVDGDEVKKTVETMVDESTAAIAARRDNELDQLAGAAGLEFHGNYERLEFLKTIRRLRTRYFQACAAAAATLEVGANAFAA